MNSPQGIALRKYPNAWGDGHLLAVIDLTLINDNEQVTGDSLCIICINSSFERDAAELTFVVII